MRNFENNLKTIIAFVVILLLIALFIPSTREFIFAFGQLLWIPFKAFFLEEYVWKTIILIAILIAGGALMLTRREERKLWILLTGIFEIVSVFLMFR